MVDDQLNLIGYHGTLMDRAKKIQREGFLSSHKEIEWLGHGVYFFEDFECAKAWAMQENRRFIGASRATVISVNICFPCSGLLDLDVPTTMDAFEQEIYDVIENILSKGPGGAPCFDDERQARCFFCNLYIKYHEEIKAIAFSFPRKIMSTIGFPLIFYTRQLCVVDNTCIEMPPFRLEAV